MTLLYVSVAFYVGFVVGWVATVIACSNGLHRIKADAARWKYVRNNAEIAGERQEGVYSWEFEAPDIDPDSIDADVDAAIAAYE